MLRRMLEEHRVGRTYGEHLFWLAFILAAIEFPYANMLARSSKSATRLSIDISGHVETRPPAAPAA